MSGETLSRREYIVLSALGAASVAGCLGGNGNGDGGDGGDATATPTEDPTELPAVHWLTDYSNDAWQDRWNDLTSSFTDETGVETNVEFVGGSGSGEQRLSNLIQSGETPDMMTTTHESVANLWSLDQLSATTDLVEEIGSAAGEPTIDLQTDQEGNVYQVPHGYYVSTFLYRSDIYDALDLSAPSSYDEVLENARKIDESDEFDAAGFMLPAAKNAPLAEGVFRHFLNNKGYAYVQWKSDAEEEVELWIPKEPTVEVLNFLKELAQYSPPPSQNTFVSGLSDWGAGAFGQLIHLNAWPASVATQVDPKVARNTGATNVPLEDGVTGEEVPVTLEPDGHFILEDGANSPGAREFLGWLYGRDAESAAQMYVQEPMRFLPTYSEILDTDTFSNLGYFQEYPSHLELLNEIQQIGDEYFSNNKSAQRAIRQGPASYLRGGYFLANMVNEVVVVGNDPGSTYDKYRGRMEDRLQEGKDRFG
jgi:multiple sugar transport system substrate-binding protein